MLYNTIVVAPIAAHLAACTAQTPTLLQKTTGKIISDHYDGVTEYPNDLNCRWRIHAPAGKVITLYIDVRLYNYLITSWGASRL